MADLSRFMFGVSRKVMERRRRVRQSGSNGETPNSVSTHVYVWLVCVTNGHPLGRTSEDQPLRFTHREALP